MGAIQISSNKKTCVATLPTLPIKRPSALAGGFYRYLNTPDCGRKGNKNCLQHAAQAKKILQDLDPNRRDINILSQDEGYVVWIDWVDPKMEELSSGTIKILSMHLRDVPHVCEHGLHQAGAGS